MKKQKEIDNLLSILNIEKISESDYIIIEQNMERLRKLMINKFNSYSEKELIRKFNNLKKCLKKEYNPRIKMYLNSLYLNGLVNDKTQTLVTYWLKEEMRIYIKNKFKKELENE